MIHLIYGDELLLMEQKLTKMKKEYNCNDENMNYSSYDLTNDTIENVYEDVITLPFFTNNKMIVVKNAIFLTTKKVKKDEHTLQLFEKCLDDIADNIHLVIFICAEKLDERKVIVKKLRKVANVYAINKLNYYKVSDSARQSIKRREAIIDDDALELLLSRTGTNLIDVASEVEKLCLYTKHITYKDVDVLVNKPVDENVFDLTSAILNRHHDKIFNIYKDLMLMNEEPVKLIILIANSMRLIYQVKLLDRKGYTDQEIAKMLGVNPFRLKYVRQEGGSFQIDELLRYLNKLSLLDVKIKTGQVDKKIGLELFMLGI